MSEIKLVLEEMRKTHETLKEHVDKQIEEVRKDGQASVETRSAVDKINADLTELRKQYDDLLVRMQKPTMKGGEGDEDPEMQLRQAAFAKYLRYGMGEAGRSVMSPDELRALSSASDKDGGFLVPAAWESGLIMKAYNEAEIRAIANVAPTGRDSVYMPALKKPSVAWGSTNLALSEQLLTAGSERLEIFDLKALVLIHNNTLDDADADVWGELSSQFASAIAEAEDTAFAVGGGSNSPQGVVADARVQAIYKATGVAAALSDTNNNGIDALINMLQGLKKTYRRNATWAFNSTTEGLIRQLKDNNKQYLWQPPVQAGSPATLLGRPVVNPESMPDVGAGTFPVVLGDFRKGYRIRDRQGITITRLVERYAEYDQTGFIVKKRTGGQVVLPEAFISLKVAVS